MADKKANERIYTIPLGAVYNKKPIYKRSQKAVSEVKSFVSRHMKSENVKIDGQLNAALWASGSKRPPRKIQVKAVKQEDGTVFVSLV